MRLQYLRYGAGRKSISREGLNKKKRKNTWAFLLQILNEFTISFLYRISIKENNNFKNTSAK